MSDEKFQGDRDAGFSDCERYRRLIDKVKEGLSIIREGRIPQKVTDTGVDFFEVSVRKLYRNAKKLSEKYSDSDGERTRELNRLSVLVDKACKGEKL